VSTYSIKEIFATIQGEGANVGTPAIFVRFAGCNMWSGRDKDRERDAKRHGAHCPQWCDTDFVDGELMSAAMVAAAAFKAASELGGCPEMIVFTGGEPLLQLDVELLRTIRRVMCASDFAIETNGATPAKAGVLELVHWVCVSPKVPADQLVIRGGSELKVVYPAYRPLDYESVAFGFKHRFVSPEAMVSSVGVSVAEKLSMRMAASYVMAHPEWRLSLQTHKLLGLR